MQKAIIFQAKAVGLKGAASLQNDILLQRNFFVCLCQKKQNVMSSKVRGTTVADGLYRAKSKCNEKVSKSKAKHEN